MDKEKRIMASLEEINFALQNLVSDVLYKKLIAYSTMRLYIKFGIKYDKEHGLNGVFIEDLISDLFVSFLNEGGRNWYKDEFPEFKDQLYSALDSQISNVVNKYKSSIEKDDIDIEKLGSINDCDKIEYKEMYDFSIKFLENINADINELLVFECLIQDLKRNQIAEELEITPKEVTNIKKRLDKKLFLLRDKLKHLKK